MYMVLKNVGSFGGKDVEFDCDLAGIIWQLLIMGLLDT